MIDKPHQINLMLGAAGDYQDGLMSLQTLIWKIEGLLGIIEDDALSDRLSDALSLLEEINAYTYMGDYDFDVEGRPIVDVQSMTSLSRRKPICLIQMANDYFTPTLMNNNSRDSGRHQYWRYVPLARDGASCSSADRSRHRGISKVQLMLRLISHEQ